MNQQSAIWKELGQGVLLIPAFFLFACAVLALGIGFYFWMWAWRIWLLCLLAMICARFLGVRPMELLRRAGLRNQTASGRA